MNKKKFFSFLIISSALIYLYLYYFFAYFDGSTDSSIHEKRLGFTQFLLNQYASFNLNNFLSTPFVLISYKYNFLNNKHETLTELESEEISNKNLTLSSSLFNNSLFNIDLFKSTILTDMEDLKFYLIEKIQSKNAQFELEKYISELNGYLLKNSNDLIPVEDLCQEIDSGRLSSYPNYEFSFKILENCTNDESKRIHKLLTLLINGINLNDIEMEYLLNDLKSFDKFTVYISVIRVPQTNSQENIHFIDSTQFDGNEARILNNLLSYVETKYVLIGNGLNRLNFYASLERLVKSLSLLEAERVGLIAGSFRNQHGHWKIGCYQYENMDFNYVRDSFYKYELNLIEAYKRSSKLDTIYCDTLNSAVPFVLKTSLIKLFRFDENMFTNETNVFMYQDFFLQLKHSGYLLHSMPDSMFFINNANSKNDYESIMEKLYDKQSTASKLNKLYSKFLIKWNLNLIKFDSIYLNKSLFYSSLIN